MWVRVPVMDIRVVRVLVRDHLVAMRMQVRLAAVPGKRVLVLVMLVMPMLVGVLEKFVGVFVQMSFPYVQPDSQRHQGRRHPEHWAWQAGPDGQ
jgi:hypothetical protein